MCRQHFEKPEMKRVATHKMLLDLKQHFNKRGIFLIEKINQHVINELNANQTKWKANTFKVCDLCYFIIIAE